MDYPDNIEEIKKFAEEIDLDVKYLLGEKYEGDLWLYFVESLPANIVFNVGGYLDLRSVESLPANIVFNVGGYLWLSCVESVSSNNELNVNGKIYFPIDHKVKVIWN
jgi:hypothetical protein